MPYSDISDFDYVLPQSLIAQKPVFPRDACRLLVLAKGTGTVTHDRFFHIGNWLKPGDVLVFNESRVLPARLHMSIGGKKIELLLTRHIDPAPGSAGASEEWLCLGKPGKLLTVGMVVPLEPGLSFEVVEVLNGGQRKIRVSHAVKFRAFILEKGETPLPPYITGRESQPEDYQTVYAREEGSVAAPTAGLHFTRALLGKLRHMGVQLEFVTLHVGIGTFLPVKTKRLDDHVMHAERYFLPPDVAARLTRARSEGRRIIAVGTTTVRVLEHAFDGSRCGLASKPEGQFIAGRGETSIFIRPGYQWKCVDGLVTNFHLPHSTLLALVCSFAGYENTLQAYRTAALQRYRFFSFGDAMLIL